MENKKNAVAIVLSADHNYAMPLGVTVLSIIKNKNKNRIFEIYILDGGLTNEDKEKINSIIDDNKKTKIYYLPIDKNNFKDFPEIGHLKIATYYRLLSPSLIKSEKLLYLDCDMIIENDLSEIYDIGLENHTIAAARDVSENYVKKYFLINLDRYFNAGLMLINSQKWQEEKIWEKSIEFAVTNSEKMKFADQDALNYILKDSWLELDKEFNFQPDKHEKFHKNINIKILHFVGSRKPWHYLYSNPYKKNFLKYLKQSPWCDYQYSDKNVKNFLKRFIIEPSFVIAKETIKKIAPKPVMIFLRNKFWDYSNLKDIAKNKSVFRSKNMRISVIIINYKTPQLTAECLRSIFALEKSKDLQIIVVDNASFDNSPKILKDEFGDTIKVIESEKNLGFSGANNRGAKDAKGDILLFLNSDTIIKDDIFTSLETIFLANPKIGALSPFLLTPSGEPQKDAYGPFPSLGRLILRQIKQKEDKEGLMKCDWLSGCALAIRKNIFEQIGGFDENFFLYYEDIDICKRIKETGFQIALDKTSTLIHLGGASLGLNKKRKEYYYASQDYYFKKHHGQLAAAALKTIRLPWKFLKMR